MNKILGAEKKNAGTCQTWLTPENAQKRIK
jgi:hypothetical protein